jgi:hypothetical protein
MSHAAQPEGSGSINLFGKPSIQKSMDLGGRRWREADEDDDAITTWIPTDRVDVEIGLPVVEGPDVAGLIYVDLGQTHHWNEAWRRWWWNTRRRS